jgi:hypothetical protein
VEQQKSGEALFADVDGEEGSEEGRAGREGVKGASAEARTAVEQEQEAGHPLGQGEQGRVAGFVEVESVGGD